MFLRTFPAIYGELLKIFTVREVAGFVRETLGSLPAAAQADCPLEAVKLQCIAKTVEGQLYINPGEEGRNKPPTSPTPSAAAVTRKRWLLLEDEFHSVLFSPLFSD